MSSLSLSLGDWRWRFVWSGARWRRWVHLGVLNPFAVCAPEFFLALGFNEIVDHLLAPQLGEVPAFQEFQFFLGERIWIAAAFAHPGHVLRLRWRVADRRVSAGLELAMVWMVSP